jgi:NAD-dependent SIR2 family protein deacetylase
LFTEQVIDFCGPLCYCELFLNKRGGGDMQHGHKLQFHCQECEAPISFSVFDREHFSKIVPCLNCGRKYAFDDETLLRHLMQFEALCHQIYLSEEILGNTSIAIDVGMHHVKVPFNILLTRLSSVIELNINGKKLVIFFRVEPLKDIPEALISS